MRVHLIFFILAVGVLQSPGYGQGANGQSVTYVEMLTNTVTTGQFLKVTESGQWVWDEWTQRRQWLADELRRDNDAVYLIGRTGGMVGYYKIDLRANAVFYEAYDHVPFTHVIASIGNRIAGPPLPDEDQWYSFTARHSGKAIGLPRNTSNDGVQLVQSSRVEDDPAFKLMRDRASGYFFIVRAHHPEKAVNVSGGNPADGVPIVQGNFDGGDNQKFMFVPVDGSYFRIVTYYGKVVDVYGGVAATADNTPVTQWTWNTGGNQQFKLTQVSNETPSFRRME
jgi:hypothetical protein